MRFLALSPHTDDCEFGCGGVIARRVSEGHSVHIAAFSSCGEPALVQESLQATDVLGIAGSSTHFFDFPARNFPSHRQAILDAMIRIREDLQPDVVFLPCTADTHQDHEVIRQEGFRAFKQITVLGYELPWNNISFSADVFITLSQEDLARKIRALECYKSQTTRYYASPTSVEALVRVRGTQIGAKRAEAFEVIRWGMK